MGDLAATRERIQSYLTADGPVMVDSDGKWLKDIGSTRVFIDARMHSNGEAALCVVTGIIAWEVPPTPQMWEYAVREAGGYYFGHVIVWDDADIPGTVDVAFRHTLLADYLDKEELMYAVWAVGSTADDLDEDFVARFGGRTFSSPPPPPAEPAAPAPPTDPGAPSAG